MQGKADGWYLPTDEWYLWQIGNYEIFSKLNFIGSKRCCDEPGDYLSRRTSDGTLLSRQCSVSLCAGGCPRWYCGHQAAPRRAPDREARHRLLGTLDIAQGLRHPQVTTTTTPTATRMGWSFRILCIGVSRTRRGNSSFSNSMSSFVQHVLI